jgi:predicted small integral membrane protein
MDLSWMAWTWQTALFFALFFATLAVMTILAIMRPETEQVGILGLPTTRGDRLFLTLLGAAFIHLAWLALAGDAPLWGASIVSVLLGAVLFRWA